MDEQVCSEWLGKTCLQKFCVSRCLLCSAQRGCKVGNGEEKIKKGKVSVAWSRAGSVESKC